ncbi:MAG TPA: 4-hydroxy-tetrahydrodipicolinate synthase [Candidatus Acidoferrum sp.]|nr:4-hydroxy-tetrahydrodipicolinate synthase [Candidatus Acidoferrum sp.]
MDLSGVFPATTTPFAPDGSVSIADLKRNIQMYNRVGLAGYVVMGSTGESVLLSKSEMEAVLVAVKETASQGKKLIAGTGAESTAETIERTKRAAQFGYDAALVKTPYYYKPVYKPEVYLAHYRRVADASPIPVLLYSVPQFTGVALEPPEVAALSAHPNIIGIKESSGNVQRVAETIATVHSGFQVLIGSAATIYPSLVIGARGAILALGSALPEKCVTLYELVRQGQHKEARELQEVILRASKLVVSECGIAGVKYVMDQRGYRGGLPRLPLLPLKDEQKKRVNALLETLEPATMRA